MNSNDILASADITAAQVVAGIYAAEKAQEEYPTRCAQTVIVTATVDAGVQSKSDIARDMAAATGCALSAAKMEVTRAYRSGQILMAHEELDPVQVKAYANKNDNKACAAVVAMTDEDAADAIAPTVKRGPSEKTDAEKDFEILARAARRAKDARESGDSARINAFREALYAIGDALDAIEEEEVA